MTQTECSLDNSCAFDAATQACREATFAEAAEAMWTQFAQYASLGEAALEAGKGVFVEWTRNEDPWNSVDLSRSSFTDLVLLLLLLVSAPFLLGETELFLLLVDLTLRLLVTKN